jgi:tetratricopeptide (TPR) repeat protein
MINADGAKSTLTFFFDDKQEFSKQVHLGAAGDLTSKTKNKIDWVLTTPDKHAATVNKLYAEYRGVPEEKGDKPSEPGKPAAPPPPAAEKATPFDSALNLLAQKDYAGAIPLLKQAVEKNPDDPNNVDVYYQLGKASFETDNLADAEAALKKAKALDPTKPGVSFYIARMYDKKGRKVQAVQALEEERALSPDSEAVLDSLAGLYSEIGQPEKAIQLYEDMIAKNPDDFAAYTSLAALYKEKGDAAKEEEIYKKLGDRDPTGKSLYNLGTIAFNHNEPEKARIYYDQVLAKDPNHAMAHLQLAYTLINLGDLSGAIGHFETFLKLNPKDEKAAEARKMVDELKKMNPSPAKATKKG